MQGRWLGWLGAVFAAGLACACNSLTGASDLDIATLLPPDSAPDAGDASVGPGRVDGGADSGGDAAPGCPTCANGQCCAAPKICLATGACGACSALNGTCTTQSDCCAPNACNANRKCVASCSAAGVTCTYAQRGNCCAGLGCDLLTGKCGMCKNDGEACSVNNGADPSCCGQYCYMSKCISD